MKEIAELKAENYELKENFEGLKIAFKKLNSIYMENCEYTGKLEQTLQEIKKYIAKICKEECGYVQKKRCPDCDCRFGAILDLITKTEEE